MSLGLVERARLQRGQKKKAVKDCMNACCRALTISCLSCAACQTEEEYCEENPSTSGCEDYETETTDSGTTCYYFAYAHSWGTGNYGYEYVWDTPECGGTSWYGNSDYFGNAPEVGETYSYHTSDGEEEEDTMTCDAVECCSVMPSYGSCVPDGYGETETEAPVEEEECVDMSLWQQANSDNTCDDYCDNWCDGTSYTSSHIPDNGFLVFATDVCCCCGGGQDYASSHVCVYNGELYADITSADTYIPWWSSWDGTFSCSEYGTCKCDGDEVVAA